jgi:hypothetical protein
MPQASVRILLDSLEFDQNISRARFRDQFFGTGLAEEKCKRKTWELGLPKS